MQPSTYTHIVVQPSAQTQIQISLLNCRENLRKLWKVYRRRNIMPEKLSAKVTKILGEMTEVKA